MNPEPPEIPGHLPDTRRSVGFAAAPSGGPRRSTASRAARSRRRRRSRRIVTAVLILVGAVAATAAAVILRPPGEATGAGASLPAVSASASPSASPSAPASGQAGAAASPGTPPVVTVVGGGDVIGDRNIRTILATAPATLLAGIAPTFEYSDFGFVNLETPLTDGGEPQTWKDVVFKGDPRLADALAAVNITVATLANNHGGDQGDEGILDTIRHAREAGVTVVGAGPDLAAAQKGAILEKDGARVAFLGFSDVLPDGYSATSSSPGISPGRSDPGAVTRAVRRAAAQADYTFVAWHWNLEFTTAPSALETGEAKAAIDAGADVVFGHHPHVLQGVQAYNGGLIFYSLGDLVFDNVTGPMAQTVLARARMSPGAIDATLIPVQIGRSGVPAVAKGATGLEILRRVRDYSAQLGTRVRIAGGKGYVHVER